VRLGQVLGLGEHARQLAKVRLSKVHDPLGDLLLAAKLGALLAELAGVIAAITVTYWFFG
jgi:hypothetical protein